MMPYVRRKTDNILVRLDTFYKQILAVKFGIGIGEDGEQLRPSERQEALLKEVFGDRVIDAAPPAWYYAEAWMAAEKFPHEWERMPIHSRAQWMAAKRVDGMIRGIERYREVIDRQNKAEAQKRQSAKKGKKR